MTVTSNLFISYFSVDESAKIIVWHQCKLGCFGFYLS